MYKWPGWLYTDGASLPPNPYSYIIIPGARPPSLPIPPATARPAQSTPAFPPAFPPAFSPGSNRLHHRINSQHACCYRSNIATSRIPLDLEPTPPKEQAHCLSEKECQEDHSAKFEGKDWALLGGQVKELNTQRVLFAPVVERDWG